MKREDMLETFRQILIEHRRGDANTEDASEAIMKTYEKALKESIGEATKMVPGLGKLLGLDK